MILSSLPQSWQYSRLNSKTRLISRATSIAPACGVHSSPRTGARVLPAATTRVAPVGQSDLGTVGATIQAI